MPPWVLASEPKPCGGKHNSYFFHKYSLSLYHPGNARLPPSSSGFGLWAKTLRGGGGNVFEETIHNFKSRLRERGYPENLVERTLWEVQSENRKLALLQKQKENKRIWPFTQSIPPNSAELKTNPHERLALNRATTIAQKKSTKTSPSCVTEEGGQSKIYS